MAKEEHRKEDLIADATAMVDRAELVVTTEPIVVGFRQNGAMSVYFDEDPVYHFNAAGELRRAFVDGAIYKAEQGRLVRMQRNRTPEAHELISGPLSDDAQLAFLDGMTVRLSGLVEALDQEQLRTLREVRTGADPVAQRFRRWWEAHPDPVIAEGPRV